MTNTITRRPVQAGDYGQDTPKVQKTEGTSAKATGKPITDGQKTLSLWSK